MVSELFAWPHVPSKPRISIGLATRDEEKLSSYIRLGSNRWPHLYPWHHTKYLSSAASILSRSLSLKLVCVEVKPVHSCMNSHAQPKPALEFNVLMINCKSRFKDTITEKWLQTWQHGRIIFGQLVLLHVLLRTRWCWRSLTTRRGAGRTSKICGILQICIAIAELEHVPNHRCTLTSVLAKFHSY